MAYPLRFFEVDYDHKVIPLTVSKDTVQRPDGSFSIWESVARKMNSIVSDQLSPETDSKEDRCICVLFVKMHNLSHQSHFFSNLVSYESGLRYTFPTIKHKGTNIEQRTNIVLHPIITVGVLDITEVYEEATDLDFVMPHLIKYWKDAKSDNAILYKIDLDHRVKFLDSSIWHRYLTLGASFESNFKILYETISENIRLQLYESVAACATLEFQCRMLKNSFIADFGDQGHNEVVTPFKFHSETQMARKTKNFHDFFIKDRNGTSLNSLRWRVLMIDDHARSGMFLINDKLQPDAGTMRTSKTSKLALIEGLLTRSNDVLNNANTKGQGVHLTFDATNALDTIIENGLDKLVDDKDSFDIILLDYLLEKGASKQRGSYGHEFLFELATSRKNNLFKRGPGGRFWIFPISSFPFAFRDKLRQLNLDGSNERWYIATGGDPICTPELFRLNFFRLLLRQINDYYLHEAALVRWADRLTGIHERRQWCNALIKQIEDEESKLHSSANFRDTSYFSNSIARFLQKQDKSYKFFLASLTKWVKKFEKYSDGQSPFPHINELRKIGSQSERFGAVCSRLEMQITYFTHDAAIILSQKATSNFNGGINSINKLEYLDSSKPLYEFPPDLYDKHETLAIINLSNHKLKEIPPEIKEHSHLEQLILNGNSDLEYIPVSALRNLSENYKLWLINLQNTKIAARCKVDGFANNPDSIEKLLNVIEKENITTKVTLNKKAMSAFISYSSKDTEMKEEFVKHLKILETEGRISAWDGQAIIPGEQWDKKIKTKLREADIVFMLVSIDFINSDYIWKEEMPQALRRYKQGKCKIIPIYLRYCDTSKLGIAQFQGLPHGPDTPISRFEDKDEAWTITTRRIREMLDDYMGHPKRTVSYPEQP